MQRIFISLCLIIVLIGVLKQDAQAGSVSGDVSLPGGAARGAVVYLENGTPTTPLTHAIVDQRNKMFLPHVSVVTRGTAIHFPNNDSVFHNVFAYFQSKKFDLGMYPRGATKTVTFDKPGLVVLLCNVHSDMSAYIMVVDTPFYAVSNSKGQFLLPHVPPGTYTLHAWHESGATLTRTVVVTAQATLLALPLARK